MEETRSENGKKNVYQPVQGNAYVYLNFNEIVCVVRYFQIDTSK